LSVIAREGVRGTTHRAIAKRAGVHLSLTTYYFRNLEELILEAFKVFMNRDQDELKQSWEKAFKYLDRIERKGLEREDRIRLIVDYFNSKILSHVRDGLENSPEGLMVEHHMFFEVMLGPALRQLSAEHRKMLLDPIVRFCGYFNKEDPVTDAELLLGTITRLEYEAMLFEPGSVDYKATRREIRRIVGWIVNAN